MRVTYGDIPYGLFAYAAEGTSQEENVLFDVAMLLEHLPDLECQVAHGT